MIRELKLEEKLKICLTYDSARFMANSLSNLIINVNADMMIRNVKIAELNISIATIFLNA